jgi:hypothetical protein
MAFLRNEGTLALIAAGFRPALVGESSRRPAHGVFAEYPQGKLESSVKNGFENVFRLRRQKTEAFPL